LVTAIFTLPERLLLCCAVLRVRSGVACGAASRHFLLFIYTPAGKTSACHIHCVSKNIPNIFDCNLKTNYQISIIFGRNILDTSCHQMTIQFPTSFNVCFCTTWGNHKERNVTFYQMRYDCLINITRKNTFYLHFWHFGRHFTQLFIFQLPAVKLLKVLAHYANTSKETLFSFIDSSINNVLLKTNPACTSCLLISQIFLNFIW